MRILFGLALLATVAVAQKLTPQTLAEDLKRGYQVLAVDLNRDGRLDLVALASGLDHLDWFENPGKAGVDWPRHRLAGGLREPINVAALDLDRDGVPELLVAYEFSNVPDRSKGLLALLSHGADVRAEWTKKDVDALPTSHRLRVANGRFVNAPLSNPTTKPPEYLGEIPLVDYGKDLKRRVISTADSGVMHGIFVTDFNGDGLEDLLTASFNGIHLLEGKKDGTYVRRRLHGGNAAAWPKGGSSDVTTVKAGGKQWLAAIDPWHGNEFAMYEPQGNGEYQRTVLDNTFQEGHTVLAIDLDGDGVEEVVYGSRKEGGTLRVARYDGKTKGWHWESLWDGKIGTASCVSGDFDGDGRKDVACIGSASQNLVVFWNR